MRYFKRQRFWIALASLVLLSFVAIVVLNIIDISLRVGYQYLDIMGVFVSILGLYALPFGIIVVPAMLRLLESRQISAIARHPHTIAAAEASVAQPDPAHGLAAGKHLSYTEDHGVAQGYAILIVIASPILFFISYGLLKMSQPVSASFLHKDMFTPLDWGVVIALTALECGCAIFFTLALGRPRRIGADDEGLNIDGIRYPWSAIRGILRWEDRDSRFLEENFWLYFDDGMIDIRSGNMFDRIIQRHQLSKVGKTLPPQLSTCQILLATCVARTGMPLQFLPKRRATTDLERIQFQVAHLRLPTGQRALGDLTLDPVSVLHAPMFGRLQLTYNSPINIIRVLRAVLPVVIFWSVTSLSMSLEFNHILPLAFNATDIIFFVSFFIFITNGLRSLVIPNVAIDVYESGVKATCLENSTSTLLSWNEIVAWGYLDQSPSQRAEERGEVIYVIFSQQQTLYWTEALKNRLAGRHVRGDRHAAYAAMSEAIHATIASKTGMAPRFLQTET